MTSAKPTLVSLGMSCQTTHQLNRFSKENASTVGFAKSPFDWLICPPESLAGWLNSGLTDFTPSEIIERRDHAWWPKFQFWFWHGFVDQRGDAKVLNIKPNIGREQDKLSYQRSTFQSLDPANTLFFWSNTQNNLTTEVFKAEEEHLCQLTTERISILQQSLDAYFETPTQLHWITGEDRFDGEIGSRSNIHFLPPEKSDWKGSAEDWDLLLKAIVGL